MIGKITGIVDIIDSEYVIIDVRGIGYMVHVSANTLTHLNAGSSISLFIETIMREDSLELYGFYDNLEKRTFLELTKVKGIGKKLALVILSYLKPEEIMNSIANENKVVFKAIPGVGLKMSERIIVELKGRFDKVENNYNYQPNDNLMQDAISALINLGINKNDAYLIVSNNLKTNPDIGLNELIKVSLKQTAK